MARDVEADVVIHDKSDRGLRSATDGLKRYDRELDRTTKATEKVGKGTDRLGKRMSDNARSVSRLNDEIGIAQKELGHLAKAFAATTNAAERNDITKVMRKQQTEIRNLTKNKGILEALEPKPQEIAGLGSRILSGITSGIGSAGPLTTALAGAGIAAAPLIGGAIAGAVIGGAGLGGVAGGIAVAVNDQRVQSALSGFKSHMQSELEDAAVPFIDTTIAGIGRIQRALDTIDFDQIFGDSSKFVGPLSEGVGSAIEDIGNAVEDLVANAGPAIDSISDGIAGIGESAGRGLGLLADNADTAADSLDSLFNLVNLTLDTTFTSLNALVEVKGFFDDFAGGIFALDPGLKLLNMAMGDTEENARRVGSGTFGASDGVNSFSRALDENAAKAANAKTNVQSYSEQLDAASRSALNAFDANTRVGEALDRVKEAGDRNGATLSANTEKGRANREALSGLAAALNAQYQATVQVNGEGAKSNEVLASNRAKFLAAAEGMGIARGKARELANQLGLIPKDVKTKASLEAAAAKQSANAYKNTLDNIPRSITTVLRTVTQSSASASALNSAYRKQSQFSASVGNFAAGNTGTTGGPEKARTADFELTAPITVAIGGEVIDKRVHRVVAAQQRANNWNNNRKRL